MKTRSRLIWSLASVAIVSLSLPGTLHAQTTYTWANSNVTGTPTSPLNWFNATQGTWTGGTPVSNNLNTIEFFQDSTTQLPNTANPSTQTSSIDNGGSAFELATLTLQGRGSATTNADLTMTISGDALNFSAATGTINLTALNATRKITYNLDSAIQLGTASSAGAVTITGNGTSDFGIGGNITELQVGGGSSLIKSGSSTVSLTGTNSFTGGTTISQGNLAITADAQLGATTGGVTFTGTDGALRFNSSNVTLDAGRTITAESSAVGVLAKLNVNSNSTLTINGQLTGQGGFNVSAGYQLGGLTINATNLSNDFEGLLRIGGNYSGNFQFTPSSPTLNISSLADGVGYGNIQFGRTLTSVGNVTFAYASNATSALVLNNRRLEIDTDATSTIRNNNTTHGVTINTDLLVSRVGDKTLALDAAASSTNNVFAGIIADGSFAAATQVVSLEKTGSGTWALTGANTYTGNTLVDLGTLELADDAQLRFVIGATGVNNAILGDASNATLNLNGDFVFDLTGAGTTLGDSWNIVDVGNLTETYGGTFSVLSTLGSFTESAGVWTRTENSVNYEFTESTGVLTVVVPEPGTLALLAGGAIAGLVALRRRRNAA
jgi:autotransporter-associated beta strand protein